MGDSTWFKSSRSADTGNCVEATWSQSSHCDSGSCVETAQLPGGMRLRDSKNPNGLELSFTHDSWMSFINGVKDGQFNL